MGEGRKVAKKHNPLSLFVNLEENIMRKVIIAIHGRSNKPRPDVLTDGWKKSIREGLKKNIDENLGSIPFEMAYYADVFYQTPEPTDPYVPAQRGALKEYRPTLLDRLRSKAGDWLDNPLDWLEEQSAIFSSLARDISGKMLQDLGKYYRESNFRDRIQAPLRALLDAHRDDEIFLISHSMGTIVAYDVLRDIGREEHFRGVTIEHFITMGSPLGLTPVKGQILVNDGRRLRTPSVINKSWTNFSDPDDLVCLDSHLRDDYASNSSGIKPQDVMVCNDFPGNPHKSYGYLRTPEFTRHINGFL
jgi:hypothetical protein